MTKILVVDDVPELLEDLEWVARKIGETLTASSAEDAIKLISEHDFDVVVTDLQMETELSGLDVLEAAKEKNPYTQVIVVTAYGTPAVSVETMRKGAFDYLERNAPGTDFLEMVREKLKLALNYTKAKR